MFAILGASGKVGRASIRRLRSEGHAVRAIVRTLDRGSELADWGCEVVPVDLTDSLALGDALSGAKAVQVICPLNNRASDAYAETGVRVDALCAGLRRAGPEQVLAISDYGAELGTGTGITLVFHRLEAQLRRLGVPRLTLLRSAEHMQNWSRQLGAAARTGILPSLHQPLTKLFPTVSAADVGTVAAELLLAGGASRVVHVEGPRRYTAVDVAEAMSELLGSSVVAVEAPRTEWLGALTRGGLSESYAQLVMALFDTHNAGRIDAEAGVGEILRGTTELRDAFAALPRPGPTA